MMKEKLAKKREAKRLKKKKEAEQQLALKLTEEKAKAEIEVGLVFMQQLERGIIFQYPLSADRYNLYYFSYFYFHVSMTP